MTSHRHLCFATFLAGEEQPFLQMQEQAEQSAGCAR
jgi:hypothetical protein